MSHSLAQLIDGVKAANRWSDPDLVRNAKKRGHELTKSNISRYRNENPLISIKGEIIEALADALGVSVAQVATAAVQSMGIPLPVYDTPSAEQAVRLDPELSIRDKDMLLSMLQRMRDSTKESADVVESFPGAPQPRTQNTKKQKSGAGDPGDIEDQRQTDYGLAGGPGAGRRGGGESETRRRRRDQDEAAERGDT